MLSTNRIVTCHKTGHGLHAAKLGILRFPNLVAKAQASNMVKEPEAFPGASPAPLGFGFSAGG